MQTKNPLKWVLAFENRTVPLSLFFDNGMMEISKKSEFLEDLEGLTEP